jgi:hypothetical protein
LREQPVRAHIAPQFLLSRAKVANTYAAYRSRELLEIWPSNIGDVVVNAGDMFRACIQRPRTNRSMAPEISAHEKRRTWIRATNSSLSDRDRSPLESKQLRSTGLGGFAN